MIHEETLKELLEMELGTGNLTTAVVKNHTPDHTPILEPPTCFLIWWNLSDEPYLYYEQTFDADILDKLEADTVYEDFVKPVAMKFRAYRSERMCEKRSEHKEN